MTQTYQNLIFVTRVDASRKTNLRELKNKDQGPIRTDENSMKKYIYYKMSNHK